MRLINVEEIPHFEVTLQGGDKKYVLLPFEHLYDIPEVKATPLDLIKQAREEIGHLDGTTDDYNRNGEVIFRNMVDVDEVLAILNKLIESEDKE